MRKELGRLSNWILCKLATEFFLSKMVDELTCASMLMLCAVLIQVVVELCLLVRVMGDALHWWEVLTRRRGWGHAKGIVGHGHVRLHFLNRIHFSATDIFGGDCARLIHEGDLVVDALGDQICVSLAGGVEEVELLAPIAFSLGFEAVVASGLGLVAFEMALSACQAAGARALWFVIYGGVARSFPGGQRLICGRVIVGRGRSSVCHGAAAVAHRAGSRMVAAQGGCWA